MVAFAGTNPGATKKTKEDKISKTISLNGTIEDAENSEKLVCAKIEIEKLGLKVFTDIEGKFELSDLSPGDYTIKVSYISYQEIEINSADLAGMKELKIELKPL
jgi:hypothetical protein